MHKKSIEASEKLHAAELKEETNGSEFDNEDYNPNESKPSAGKKAEIEHCDWVKKGERERENE